MSVPAQAFGGRIPILRPDVMSNEQKQVYDRIIAGTVPWATNAGFRVKADGGGLLGPYNSQLLSPGTDAGYLDMLDAEKKHTSLSKRVREVIILSVGAVWKADYEIYAHSAAARSAGLSESAIRTLAAGGAYRTIWTARKRSPTRTPGRRRPVCRGRAVLRAPGLGGHDLPYRDISPRLRLPELV